MRAHEFLVEDEDTGQDGSSAGTGTRSKTTGKFHKSQSAAIKGMKTYPDIPSHYYDMYRMGVHMAGSPEDQVMSKTGPTANQMVTLAYTDEDAEIINNSRRAMGFASKTVTSKDSKETTDINRVSPTAAKKLNKYGI